LKGGVFAGRFVAEEGQKRKKKGPLVLPTWKKGPGEGPGIA